MLMGRSSKERVTENKHKSPREAHSAGLPARGGGQSTGERLPREGPLQDRRAGFTEPFKGSIRLAEPPMWELLRLEKAFAVSNSGPTRVLITAARGPMLKLPGTPRTTHR